MPGCPHSWSVTPKEAIEIQSRLAPAVRLVRPEKEIRLVAAVDVSYAKRENRCHAAVALWNVELATAVETRTASVAVSFPYVPGLLSFREIPPILTVLELLEGTPDAVICDGQGYAHPRRFGLACHLGVLVHRPTLGCAKSRLCGTYEAPAEERGSSTPLLDRGEVVGRVVRTKCGARPVFVSPGHRMDAAAAEEVVLACCAGHRLPEPARLAHALASSARRRDETSHEGRRL